jgi:hypothetical protein
MKISPSRTFRDGVSRKQSGTPSASFHWVGPKRPESQRKPPIADARWWFKFPAGSRNPPWLPGSPGELAAGIVKLDA